MERGAELDAVQKAASDAVSRAVAEAFASAGRAMTTPPKDDGLSLLR